MRKSVRARAAPSRLALPKWTFLVSLLPTGFFALSWTERLDRLRRETRGLLAVLVDRDLRGHLLGRRRAIMAEFQDLLRLVPEPVLDGRPP